MIPTVIAVGIAARLGRAQKRTILSLSATWGPADSHACAKRMFCGVQGKFYLVKHRHKTDNCWSLTDLGLAVQAVLVAELGPN